MLVVSCNPIISPGDAAMTRLRLYTACAFVLFALAAVFAPSAAFAQDTGQSLPRFVVFEAWLRPG
jgi:hypothetical protein